VLKAAENTKNLKEWIFGGWPLQLEFSFSPDADVFVPGAHPRPNDEVDLVLGHLCEKKGLDDCCTPAIPGVGLPLPSLGEFSIHRRRCLEPCSVSDVLVTPSTETLATR